MQPSARGMLLLWDRLVRRRGVMPVCVMWLLAAPLSPEVPSNAALAN